jgi:hypothetical protein
MEHMSDYANSRMLIYAGTEMKPGSAHETLQIIVVLPIIVVVEISLQLHQALQIQNHKVVGKT